MPAWILHRKSYNPDPPSHSEANLGQTREQDTRLKMLLEDFAKIVAAYNQRETIEKYAYLAGFDEIGENDFNLNIPRYVDTFEEELSKVKFRMAGYLEELGLVVQKTIFLNKKMKRL